MCEDADLAFRDACGVDLQQLESFVLMLAFAAGFDGARFAGFGPPSALSDWISMSGSTSNLESRSSLGVGPHFFPRCSRTLSALSPTAATATRSCSSFRPSESQQF